jgi:hypothetical protein
MLALEITNFDFVTLFFQFLFFLKKNNNPEIEQVWLNVIIIIFLGNDLYSLLDSSAGPDPVTSDRC